MVINIGRASWPDRKKKDRHRCRSFRGSGGGGGSRTPVREPSDPGSTCLATRFFLAVMPPEGQGMHAGQLRFDLTPGPETRPDAILLSDPESEAQAQPVGSRLVFRQPVRSCRRWQLTFCSQVLRGLLPPRHAPGYVRSTSKPERPQKKTRKPVAVSDVFRMAEVPVHHRSLLQTIRCEPRTRLSCHFLPV